jgi:hypothetical protein
VVSPRKMGSIFTDECSRRPSPEGNRRYKVNPKCGAMRSECTVPTPGAYTLEYTACPEETERSKGRT